MTCNPLPSLALAAVLASCAALPASRAPRNDSGGYLIPEQAAYDVLAYDLRLVIDPDRETLEGAVTVRARVVHELETFVLDLDRALAVEAVSEEGEPLAFERPGGRIRIDLGRRRDPGEELELVVEYGGRPRVAPRPPWEGGFTWARTADGRPWVATSNQGEGGDLWWPCKDHPSDKPEELRLQVTVPAGLVCASNGRLVAVEEGRRGERTYHWAVTTPIPNYSVALNIAPYVEVTAEYESVTGELLPATFWALPESEEQARAILPQFLEHLRFFERLFGPYPFRADKYGIVETPHLGMEHQTILAYGNQFREDERGYDWLHHHELAHEWFANLVTAPDWNDFWIHEGFGTYAQNLYEEELGGPEAYRASMAALRVRILNAKPVAPRAPHTSGQMYFVDLDAPDGELQGDGDIYFKGAWVLHTLRYLLGDEVFFPLLRRMAYPDPALEAVTDGSHCRFATTDDFLRLAEQLSGRRLDWFFAVYLRQPELPELVVERAEGELALRWEVPAGLPFPMPVELEIDGERRRVDVDTAGTRVPLQGDAEVEVDPDGWLLLAE